MCNRNFYGYRKINVSTLEIIPEEAEVVKLLFETYASGMGTKRIAKMFRERGITNRKGEFFPHQSLTNMIKNEKYYGGNTRNKYTQGMIFNHTTLRIRDKSE